MRAVRNFNSNNIDLAFQSFLLGGLTGEYTTRCLERVRRVGGTIVGFNTEPNEGSDGRAEVLYVIRRDTPETVEILWTDDCSAELYPAGRRYDASGKDLLPELVYAAAPLLRVMVA